MTPEELERRKRIYIASQYGSAEQKEKWEASVAQRKANATPEKVPSRIQSLLEEQKLAQENYLAAKDRVIQAKEAVAQHAESQSGLFKGQRVLVSHVSCKDLEATNVGIVKGFSYNDDGALLVYVAFQTGGSEFYLGDIEGLPTQMNLFGEIGN